MKSQESKRLFERAKAVMPGGVNSPVRSFTSVGGTPEYIARGAGAYVLTVDAQQLVDFCGSWGPLILGHAHEEVIAAIYKAASDGTSFGANTAVEVEFAELLCRLVPSVEQLRLVSSGTEAVMTALRIARGFTGRDRIVKFDGCYHGHSDSMLVSAGSGLLSGGISSSTGVPAAVVRDTFIAPYNDLDSVADILTAHGGNVAAVIVEPIAGNMGLVMPQPGFLKTLRELTLRHGVLLIFDEVITGFRVGLGTYGDIVGVTPDLTCLGKIIGGGLPVGCVGGRRDIMAELAPSGSVYQAGTLSGNPVAVAAGLATLRVLERDMPYRRMAGLAKKLAYG